MATGSFTAAFRAKNGLVVESTATSTGTTSGSAVIYGGIGIAGNIIAGGSIVAGGVRTTSTSTSPAGATPGDIWYNTLTDDLYRYTTDGTSTYWLDITGPGVATSAYTFTGGPVPNATYISQTYNQGIGQLQVAGGASIAGPSNVQSLYVQGGNNYLLNSQTFLNWTSTNLVSTSSQLAPDGSASAYWISANNSISQHYLSTSSSTPGNVLSVFVQGTGNTAFSLSQNTINGATFNPTAGTVSSVVGGAASITAVGGNWYRATFISNQTSNSFYVWPNASTSTYVNNGTYPGIVLWGTQLESGSTASSYTPTTTSPIITANNINVYYQPVSAVGSAIQVTAANSQGGSGYADFLRATNSSSGTPNPNKTFRINQTGGLEIINSSYTATLFTMDDNGNISIAGNLTANGSSGITIPNRPAFRVYGNGGSVSATTTMTGTNWVLDYQQGSALNSTTGIFTAPVAGLYSISVVVRTASNSLNAITQVIIQKNSSGSLSTQIMVEFGNNTSMNHAGGSSITKLAVGDTLRFIVSAGQISFDVNDNWSVAYIG